MSTLNRRHWLALVALCTAAACSPEEARRLMTPPAHDAVAREYLATLHRGDLAAAVAVLLPELQQVPGIRDSLAAAHRTLPTGGFDTVRVVGVDRYESASSHVTHLTYELHSPAGWALALVTVVDSGGTRRVGGVRIERAAAPLAEVNAFHLSGKTWWHVLVLSLAVTAAGVSLLAAVAAARTPMPRRWLWAAVALVGISRFTLDWTSGAYVWAPLHVVFFSAGFFRPGVVGPWLISVGFPLGALAALYRVRQFRRTQMPGAPPSAEFSTAG